VELFRVNVVRLLTERGIASTAFAAAIDDKSTAWASMFLGGRRDTTMKTAEKIAAFLGVDLWRLLIDESEVDVKLLPKRKQLPTTATVVKLDPTERRLLGYFRRIQDQAKRELAVDLVRPLVAAEKRATHTQASQLKAVPATVTVAARHRTRKSKPPRGE
jgi:hypothetical protein